MELDINYLLEIPEETTQIEFKTLGGKSVVKKILQTIVAMSNTYGGDIVLGIDDPEKTTRKGLKRVFGIEENKEIYDEIFKYAKDISPVIDIHSNVICLKVDEIDRTVCVIKVAKGSDAIRYINNEVFIRGKKGNIRLNPQEVVKYSYARGFNFADNELVDVSFKLLETEIYHDRRKSSNTPGEDIKEVLFKRGLAKENSDGVLMPTRAAIMLFAEYPTNLMDTKCAIRVYQYTGTGEKYEETPNLVAKPVTIEGPVIVLISKAQEYILGLLRNGVRLKSGFINKYVIPKRAIEEAITNAVIHRDYYIKRDIEINIFEDRVECNSPGLFSFNITPKNIGYVRADKYRNDLLVKHLREFPDPPNLDRNEGVVAMRNEMKAQNLFPPIYLSYPLLNDTVRVVLFNEHSPTGWDKVSDFLQENTYIDNKTVRDIVGLSMHEASGKLKSRVKKGFLLRIPEDPKVRKGVKYKSRM